MLLADLHQRKQSMPWKSLVWCLKGASSKFEGYRCITGHMSCLMNSELPAAASCSLQERADLVFNQLGKDGLETTTTQRIALQRFYLSHKFPLV